MIECGECHTSYYVYDSISLNVIVCHINLFAFSGRLPQCVTQAAAQSLYEIGGHTGRQQGGVPACPVVHGSAWRCHGSGQVRTHGFKLTVDVLDHTQDVLCLVCNRN